MSSSTVSVITLPTLSMSKSTFLFYLLHNLTFYCLRVTQNALSLPFFFKIVFNPSVVLRGTGKTFLSVFNFLLPKTYVTITGTVFLDTLVNVFVRVLCTTISGVGDQYLFNMHVKCFWILFHESYQFKARVHETSV